MPQDPNQPPATGFGRLRCPLCWENKDISDDDVTIELTRLDEFYCVACEGTFGVDEILGLMRDMMLDMERWKSVLAWLKTAPQFVK